MRARESARFYSLISRQQVAQEVREKEAIRRFFATSAVVRLWQAEVEVTCAA